jgi:hypothetical protein
MAEVKKNERFIPTKNYIITAIIIIGAILLTLYGFKWYRVIKENKVSTSYLIKEKVISKEIQELDELDSIFSEVPKSYFVYVSYTGNEEIYNMEKDLEKIIKDYDLGDKFYFLNVTSIKDDKNLVDQLNTKLKLEAKKIISIPTIIYYVEGEPAYIITKEGNAIMQAGDFQKLLDINNITK